MDVYTSIKAKYGFEIPAEYRRMEQDGFFDLKHPGAYFDPANEPTYLWVPEAEWLRPKEILAYEPQEFHKPGFVPFAFTGAGDHWCWWPSEDPEAVVLCPHDEAIGVFDAPTFLGSLYHRFLDFALHVSDGEEDKARMHFGVWTERLPAYFPPLWIDTLRCLAKADCTPWQLGKAKGRGFLDPVRRNELVSRDLGFPRLGEKFEWMT